MTNEFTHALQHVSKACERFTNELYLTNGDFKSPNSLDEKVLTMRFEELLKVVNAAAKLQPEKEVDSKSVFFCC